MRYKVLSGVKDKGFVAYGFLYRRSAPNTFRYAFRNAELGLATISAALIV